MVILIKIILVVVRILEELAVQCGIDPKAFVDTIARYNEACKTGVDPLGKAAQYLTSIDNGTTLYAFHAAPRPYSSIGGLNVSKDMEVLTTDGETRINGLYAGGTDALGATAPSFGGELQLWAYMSGYDAAESAVAYTQQ